MYCEKFQTETENLKSATIFYNEEKKYVHIFVYI